MNMVWAITCKINTFRVLPPVKICKFATFVIVTLKKIFTKSGIIYMEIVKT